MALTLYDKIEYKAAEQDKPLYKVAEEMGITNVSLSRMKRHKPSKRTYFKVAKFLEEDFYEVMKYPITLEEWINIERTRRI